MLVQQMISDENIKKEAHYAYMMMFDANNMRERKQLLNQIIKDPRASYLFYIHCNPSQREKDLVTEVFMDDLESCYQLFTQIDQNDQIRQDVFATLLTSSQYSHDIASKDDAVTEDEKRIIFELYHDVYYQKFQKSDVTTFYNEYFSIFAKFIPYKEKEQLTNNILESQLVNWAEFILEYDEWFPDDLKERLESLTLMNNLNTIEIIFN